MKKDIPVIFDLDGTLFRSESVELAAFKRAFSANGLEGRSRDEIMGFMGLIMHEVCIILGITDEAQEEKFKHDLVMFEKEEIETSGELFEGIEDLLNGLHEEGLTLCICTNGVHEYVYSILDKFKLTGLFKEVWTEREGFTKSMAVGSLADRYGREGFIMVGDRSSDIEAARENGGISIGAAYGYGGSEPYSADHVANSANEVGSLVRKIVGGA